VELDGRLPPRVLGDVVDRLLRRSP
jgi:hypothetical protein